MKKMPIDELCSKYNTTTYKLAKVIPEDYHTLRKRARLGWSAWYENKTLYMQGSGGKFDYEVDLDAI